MAGAAGPHHFAKNCPDLKSLSLPLIDPVIDLETVESASRTNNKLRTLGVGSKRVKPSDVNLVATYLATLFPNLREIERDSDEADMPDGWGKVAALLPMFALVRRKM
ncbi:hypothetical protein BKA70DRAFT_1433818 [Coprinopsis sp. MPI-PUGE-AT-0042]|nr:hypothetical protein BKA70DRAFT_1433818 [Coprinopsis sp. MPI-PUGE-AT-0042]